MSDEVRGSCVCGAVTYTITPPWLAFQHCFCSRCRKGSGAAHAANLFVQAEHLTWSGDESLVRRFELPTAKYWSRSWCDACGSALPWLTRTGKAWVVPAGGLDDDPGVRADRNIYFGSRADWLGPYEGLETFETYPGRD